jgi:leader peptidase (prepilin peptidase)/N-methyltransferase
VITTDPALVRLAIVLAAVSGLIIGSFLNVVVWRVPRGESIVSPPSACPSCGHRIRGRDNVPVVSWLLLRGRCRDCGERISARYPLVEAGTAALFAAVAWRFGLTWELLPFLYLAAISVALALIDLDVKRLPDAIVLPSYVVAGVVFVALAVAQGDYSPLVRAAIGGAALFTFYFLLAFAYPSGMGFGDVKLAGLLGIFLGWLGWGSVVVGAFTAFVLGGVYAIVLLLARRATRKTGVPFGPWMLAGAAVGIAIGEPLWAWYLGLMT